MAVIGASMNCFQDSTLAARGLGSQYFERQIGEVILGNSEVVSPCNLYSVGGTRYRAA